MVLTTDKKLTKELLDWALHILIAIVLGLLIVTFVAQRTVVFNYSMEPTLHEGDNLIAEKITPKFGNLKAGDIVTIKNASPSLEEASKTIIKRIIALEGQVVDIRGGRVYVDKNILEESYIKGNSTQSLDPQYCLNYTIPEGCVYVLGDNRAANIVDSRTIGPISIDKIESKAVFRIFPFDRFGRLK